MTWGETASPTSSRWALTLHHPLSLKDDVAVAVGGGGGSCGGEGVASQVQLAGALCVFCVFFVLRIFIASVQVPLAAALCVFCVFFVLCIFIVCFFQ